MKRKFFDKRKIVNILLTVALATMSLYFSSCDKMILPEEDPTEQVAVNLNANIGSATTYVANDQWEAGDKVGLYMKRAGQALTTTGAIYNDAANVQMSLSGQTLTSTLPVNYPTGGNVDFIAYYPYTASVDNYDFTIPVNIAGQAAGLPAEILYSNNVTNQAPTASAVTLNFTYALAKIELTVTNGANSTLTASDFAAATVTVESLYTQAKFKLADGTFTGYQAKQSVTFRRKSVTATFATFEALAMPTNEEITFLFDVGGSVYRHKMPVNYASHTLYKYNFALDFPSFPNPTASLLNTVIISRGEQPEQNISVDASKKMTMTTAASEIKLWIAGTGKFTINWGDGSPSDTYMLGGITSSTSLGYKYSSTSTHTITITGENVTILGCQNNQLTELDVSKNTALLSLDCTKNQLTELDVSKNTMLIFLLCVQNQLTSLDVSKNTALNELRCWDNLLTKLDLNTDIESLYCHNNLLTSLDVSKNTALQNLYCFNNILTSLDVSKNTSLNSFVCSSNQIEVLDVSKNTILAVFSCFNNQLTKLDVSKNSALWIFECYDNQLTELDISNNNELYSLKCYNNQLIELDVSKNTKLTSLQCSNNRLTELDVSKNTAIIDFGCGGNQLTELNVSKNGLLGSLSCDGNQLTELDVSNNTSMGNLLCANNKLIELDVSKNISLKSLDIRNNLLITNTLNELFGTLQNRYFDSEKKIYIGGNPGTDTCDRSIAINNGWEVLNDL